jgi:hypothetical protein
MNLSIIPLLATATLLLLGLAEPLCAQTAPGTPTTDAQQVEKLLAARRAYQRALESLRVYYLQNDDRERAAWAEDELLQFHRIAKRAFRLELDVPPPTLQPLYNFKEANALYIRALEYKDKGFGTDYLDNQRSAELLLQRLLTDYPQCDKIDDAAYQLGDLYESKAYQHYDRAAAYFERCVQWNPQTQWDARLRAARLYERLEERTKARGLYKDILDRETDPRRLEEVRTRLAELSGKE